MWTINYEWMKSLTTPQSLELATKLGSTQTKFPFHLFNESWIDSTGITFLNYFQSTVSVFSRTKSTAKRTKQKRITCPCTIKCFFLSNDMVSTLIAIHLLETSFYSTACRRYKSENLRSILWKYSGIFCWQSILWSQAFRLLMRSFIRGQFENAHMSFTRACLAGKLDCN